MMARRYMSSATMLPCTCRRKPRNGLPSSGGESSSTSLPTGASWMNQIEIWNGIITRKLIRCGTFSSVKALNKAIESFLEHWNSDCAPIAWTATAEEILDKVRTVTSRMEALLRATEIDDVAGRAA